MRRMEAALARAGRRPTDAIDVVHASEVVTMHDHPGHAFRTNRTRRCASQFSA